MQTHAKILHRAKILKNNVKLQNKFLQAVEVPYDITVGK